MRRRPRHRRTAFALLVPVALVATLLIGAPAIPDASATPIRPDYSGSDLWLHYPKIETRPQKRYAKSATAVIAERRKNRCTGTPVTCQWNRAHRNTS